MKIKDLINMLETTCASFDEDASIEIAVHDTDGKTRSYSIGLLGLESFVSPAGEEYVTYTIHAGEIQGERVHYYTPEGNWRRDNETGHYCKQ